MLPLILLITLLSATATLAEITYWVDPICVIRDPEFRYYLAEARQWAGSAWHRIIAADVIPDQDMERAFIAVFKTHLRDPTQYDRTPVYINYAAPGSTGNTARDHVREAMYIIMQLRETPNRATANLRIYCDNESEFTQAPDGYMYDYLNGVKARSLCSIPGVPIMSHTTTLRILTPDTDQPQGHRQVMSVCDYFFNSRHPDLPTRLASINAQRSLLNAALDDFQVLRTSRLLHELLHLYDIGLITSPSVPDVGQPGPFLVGWNHVVRILDTQSSLKDSESFSYFALLCGLLNSIPAGQDHGGYALWRFWDLQNWPALSLVSEGYLQAYEDTINNFDMVADFGVGFNRRRTSESVGMHDPNLTTGTCLADEDCTKARMKETKLVRDEYGKVVG